jgi:peptidoglycan hydrolase-like protein with peptidoglycan-binding domain
MAAGYAYVLETYGYQDGQFDYATRKAVMKFQQNHSGTAQADGYGVYGAATNTALQAALHGAGG